MMGGEPKPQGNPMQASLILAAAEAAAPAKDQGFYQTLIMIGIAIVFFYFILWRPEQKRRKKMDTMRKSLKKGDKVIAMGIRATVDEVRENTVILKQVDGAKIEMLVAAITEIEQETAPAPQKN
jgi:preprotein translocase subunit YajC